MARNRKPRTPLQYWLYIAAFFGFYIPWKPCCHGHDTPFDMMWSLWTENPQSFIAIGARSTFKTLGLGLSELMDLVFKGCGIAHIGAIEAQALKCYSYVRKGLRHYPDLLDKPPLLSKTELNNGGRLEILPCTMNRVNSPHEPKVRFDEVELADPLAYHDAKFIASTDDKNTPASIVYTTTRKFAYGLAQKEIERALADQQRVLIWCYKDATERCSEERSGIIPTVYHIDPEKLYISPIPSEHSREYLLFNKCGKCPIITTCRGDLKRASGIKPINDIITIFRDATIETWLAQMECKRPMRRGLVLYNFSEKNFKSIDWEMFQTPEGKFNHDRFTQLWGKDWGWSPDATVIGILDRFSQAIYIIKEFFFHSKTTPTIARELMSQWVQGTFFGLPEDIVCDKSEPGLISVFQDAGFGMATAPEVNDVEFGIDLLNTLAADPNEGGAPRIFIDSKRCPTLYSEITEGYRRKLDPRTNEPGDTIEKKNDHGCLVGETLINTYGGPVAIKDLVGTTGKVFCVDDKNNKMQVSTFRNVCKTGDQVDVLEVELEDGRSFKLTADHPVLVRRGWAPVSALKEGDRVVDLGLSGFVCDSFSKVRSIKDGGVADVYNMYVDRYNNFAVEGGLIVSNCDALRYLCAKHMAPGSGIVGQYVGATSSIEEQLTTGAEISGADMDMLLMLSQQYDDNY